MLLSYLGKDFSTICTVSSKMQQHACNSCMMEMPHQIPLTMQALCWISIQQQGPKMPCRLQNLLPCPEATRSHYRLVKNMQCMPSGSVTSMPVDLHSGTQQSSQGRAHLTVMYAMSASLPGRVMLLGVGYEKWPKSELTGFWPRVGSNSRGMGLERPPSGCPTTARFCW